MAKILVVGLNPAWQKILEFPSFRTGEVNRAVSQLQLASGKGMNTAKVLRRLGHEVSLLQITGGANGRRCREACESLGIRSIHADVAEETRECVTLAGLSNGEVTEIVGPSSVQAADLELRLLAALPEEADAFDAVAFSGTVPPGGPMGMFGSVLKRRKPRVTVLDSTLAAAKPVLGQVVCVKVNRKEYEELAAAAGSQGRGQAPLFLVTDGPGEAAMIRGGRTLARFRLPRIEGVRSPIGAGDTVTAGMVHHLLAGLDAAEAFRHALAMGSASCLKLAPAVYSDEDVQSILPKVEMFALVQGTGAVASVAGVSGNAIPGASVSGVNLSGPAVPGAKTDLAGLVRAVRGL